MKNYGTKEIKEETIKELMNETIKEIKNFCNSRISKHLNMSNIRIQKGILLL